MWMDGHAWYGVAIPGYMHAIVGYVYLQRSKNAMDVSEETEKE